MVISENFMMNKLRYLAFVILLLMEGCQGIVGRRRQTGSRRRSGLRPNTNIKYGIPNWAWYTIIGVASAFIVALIAAIVYYCVVVRRRRKKEKESEKYKPIGGGYVPREQKEREMEMYLARNPPTPLSPSYHDYGRKQRSNDI